MQGEDEDKFDAFMLPITQSFESLGQVLLNSSANYNTGTEPDYFTEVAEGNGI